jgi:outer membrane lipoprotein LolB
MPPALLHLSRLTLLAGLLTGCASKPIVTPDDWPSHSAAIAALQNWDLSAKIALKSPDNAQTARLRWQQRGARSQLVISGPVGWQQATLISEDGKLELERDGKTELLDAQRLTSELGWPLPVELLPWWVRGIPAPGAVVTQRTFNAGRLQILQQAGWRVAYDNYRQVGQYSLPGQLRLTRDDLEGRMIIKRWTLPQSTP